MRRLVPLLALVLAPLHAAGQEDRFELGQRLRQFEAEYDRVTDAVGRKRAVPHLTRATRAFFSSFLGGGLAEAARGLDLARHSLRSPDDVPAGVSWADSCVARPARRLVDPGDSDMTVSLSRYYPPKSKRPDGVKWRVGLFGKDGKAVTPLVVQDIKALPLRLKLPLKGLKEGDYELRSEVVLDGKTLAGSAQTVSAANRIKARLEKLEKAVTGAGKKTTDMLTATRLLATVHKLAKGETLETNLPAARLLAEAEAVVGGMNYYGKGRPGEFWLSLAVRGRGVPVRIRVPEQAKQGKPLPLVIALHGAGGSENMFFDGYGNGAVARLAARRGWIVVATRDGLTDGVIDALARLYPVDRSKVFLVGHSMGAGQAVAAASKNPDRYAAVAALGGGGVVRPSEAVTKLPFYVGIGKSDFALPSARSLRRSLERAKVETVVYKELDDVEHLAVVQICLSEVFKLFDERAKRLTKQ
jgi:dienelactone hydrolase